MTAVVVILFMLALLDQYLTIQLEREGYQHLHNLLERARWRKQRVAVRVLGGVLVIIFLFALGRYT